MSGFIEHEGFVFNTKNISILHKPDKFSVYIYMTADESHQPFKFENESTTNRFIKEIFIADKNDMYIKFDPKENCSFF